MKNPQNLKIEHEFLLTNFWRQKLGKTASLLEHLVRDFGRLSINLGALTALFRVLLNAEFIADRPDRNRRDASSKFGSIQCARETMSSDARLFFPKRFSPILGGDF